MRTLCLVCLSGLSVWSVVFVVFVLIRSRGLVSLQARGLPACPGCLPVRRPRHTTHPLPPCLPASLRDDHGNNIIDSFHRNSIQFNSIQFNSKFNSIQFNSIQNIMANLA